MGYWATLQVRTMSSSVVYKSKLIMGVMPLRRVLIITCEMFLSSQLRSTRRIAILVSGRGRVDVCKE